VDAAVEMVEQNNLEGAISVLKEGIATFEPKFPGRYAWSKAKLDLSNNSLSL
jgi:hypothetical protein